MQVLETTITPQSDEFRANVEAMEAHISTFRDVEQKVLDLAESAKAKLSEVSGVTVLSPSERRDSSGLVTFAVDGKTPISVVERLWEDHKIVVRQVGHPEGVRASLHFFNTEEEIELLIGGVRELA